MTTIVGSSTLLGCVLAMALNGCTAQESRSSPQPSPASSTHTQTPAATPAATPAPPSRRTSEGVFDYDDVVPTTLLRRTGSYSSVPNE